MSDFLYAEKLVCVCACACVCVCVSVCVLVDENMSNVPGSTQEIPFFDRFSSIPASLKQEGICIKIVSHIF